ncbi:UNVERIFIED_CONTAM: camp-dependent protein kinase catalytic subunit [Siphonaria sp. JEL0065]|nr:camp-dependent protein kinase catalytic subunit [Siphonaria sp. JEL0065]
MSTPGSSSNSSSTSRIPQAKVKTGGKVGALVAAFNQAATAAEVEKPKEKDKHRAKLTKDSYSKTATNYSFPNNPPPAQKRSPGTDMARSRTYNPARSATPVKDPLSPAPIVSQTDLSLNSKQPYKSPYQFAPIPVKKPAPATTASPPASRRLSVASSTTSTVNDASKNNTPPGSSYVSPYAYRPSSRANTPRNQDVAMTDDNGAPIVVAMDRSPSKRISTVSSSSSGGSADAIAPPKRNSPRSSNGSEAGANSLPRRVRKASLVLSTSITPTKPQWRYTGPQTTTSPSTTTAASTASGTPRVLYKAVSTVKRPTSPTPIKSPSTGNAYTSKLTGITSTATVTIAARNQIAAGLNSKDASRRPGSAAGVARPTKTMTATTIRVPPSSLSKTGGNGRATPVSKPPTPLPGGKAAASSTTFATAPPPSMARTKSGKTTVRIGPSTTIKLAKANSLSTTPSTTPKVTDVVVTDATTGITPPKTTAIEDTIGESKLDSPPSVSETVSIIVKPLTPIVLDAAPVPPSPVVVTELVEEQVKLEVAVVLSISTIQEQEEDVVSSVIADVVKTEAVEEQAKVVETVVADVSVDSITLSSDVDVVDVTNKVDVVAEEEVVEVAVEVLAVEGVAASTSASLFSVVEEEEEEVTPVVEAKVEKMDVLVEEDEPMEEGEVVVAPTIAVVVEVPVVDKMEVVAEEDEELEEDAIRVVSTPVSTIVQTATPPKTPEVIRKASFNDVNMAESVVSSSGADTIVFHEEAYSETFSDPALERPNLGALMEENEEEEESSLESPSPDFRVERPSAEKMLSDDSIYHSELSVPVERVSLSDLMEEDESMPEEQSVPVERVSLHDLTMSEPTEQQVPSKHDILDHLLMERHVPVERITLDQLLTSHEMPMDSSSSELASADTEMLRTPSPPMPLSIYDCKPFFIQDFKLVRTVGTGSFGRVHLAYHLASNTYVALKVLRKHDVVKLKQVEHTLDEKRILEALSNGCPFLVHLYGSFMDNEHLYLVLEYIQGGELFTYLRNMDKLDNEAAKFYAAEVVLAFEYLHSADVVYRDLKPENLVSFLGDIWLFDY